MQIDKKNLRTAILISGSGTTAEAVIRAMQSGKLDGIDPVIVISSRKNAGGIQKAHERGVPTQIVQRRDFLSSDSFGTALLNILRRNNVDLIAQLGWLALTSLNVVKCYKTRIFNQHPGPLDLGKNDFGGRGMYGARVICAVLAYNWLTGKPIPIEATTHYVTKKYDMGSIIRRKPIDISAYQRTILKDAEFKKNLIYETKKVQAIVLPYEHEVVIQTLADFARNKVIEWRRRQPLIEKENITFLDKAKQLAIELFPYG